MEQSGATVSEALKAAEQRGAALREFGLQDQWPHINSSWSTLLTKLPGFTPEQSLAAHTALGDELRQLLSRVGEESGLSLDPAAETYYLIIPSLQLLPEAAAALGAVRAQGALAARAGHISSERREALAGSIATRPTIAAGRHREPRGRASQECDQSRAARSPDAACTGGCTQRTG